MHDRASKTDTNKKQSSFNGHSQKNSNDDSTFRFVDERPDAIAQRKLRDMVHNSHQVQQAAQLQAIADRHSVPQEHSAPRKENNTGLPDGLKGGLESLSGMSLDHVTVHYNSSKPAQLNAHAYTQGTDIHVAPGQERHLAHEGWHVVQQEAGRVAPTTRMGGTPVNDNRGLEAEADNMGAKAEAMGATAQRAAAGGNVGTTHGAALASPGSGVAQLKKVQIKNATYLVEKQLNSIYDGKRSKETVKFGDDIEIDDTDSMLSRRGRNANREHDKKRKKDIRWFKVSELNGTNIVGANKYLREETFFDDVAPEIRNKAHGKGGATAKQVTDNQKEYQEWLEENNVSMGRIMDSHRSVGFEYEFATYRKKNKKKKKSGELGAHIELGRSEETSPLFPGIGHFVLETDSDYEIEAVTPPLLIKDKSGNLNKRAAKRIYNVYRKSLIELRENIETKSLKKRKLRKLTGEFEAAGLGGAWDITNEGNKLHLDKVRKKHSSDAGGIYSQMNISLTSKEISEYTKIALSDKKVNFATKKTAGFSDAVIWEYSQDKSGLTAVTLKVNNLLKTEIENAITNYIPLTAAMAIRSSTKPELKAARINISKGLAGLVAIPSILASNDNINVENHVTISSVVKEVCEIWVKDSIPNIVDNSLEDMASRKIMKTVLQTIHKDLKNYLKEIVGIELTKMGPHDTSGYRDKFKNEYEAMMGKVIIRLDKDEPRQNKLSKAPEFGEESFDGSGKGVRKDTFVNIASGRNRKMHLAELRNDDALKKLLKP